MFIKTFTLMLLHPRANLADQEQNHRILICVPWPLSAKQAAKITFSSVKHRTLQSIKKGYRASGILARGYRRKDKYFTGYLVAISGFADSELAEIIIFHGRP